MDSATIIGYIVGIIFIIWGISIDGSVLDFIHLPSIMIVFGGTFAAALIGCPIRKMMEIFKMVRKVIVSKPVDPGAVIDKIIELANIARREGLLALEEAAYQLEDGFLQKGILLIVDGTDPELVRSILETELTFIEDRHDQGRGVFEAMARYAPAFGMLGTLIGLINMLKYLDRPESIGPNMAIALITTFYGVLLANLVFSPIANKLKSRNSQEIFIKEMMLEGMLSIQAGENPRIIEEKLKAFLAPKFREQMKEKVTEVEENEE
ncbi:MAG TPA: flagellar motor protein [Clostridiales bacterium]|nr:flagellar motor protein [Clostridiales bacterium]